MTLQDKLRTAATLGHVVPSVRIDLRLSGNRSATVASNPANEAVHPCAFRGAVIRALMQPNLDTCSITSVDIGGGLSDIGGGLYQHDELSGVGERWLVTTLDYDHVKVLIETYPQRDDAAAISVILKPDPDLQTTAICIRGGPETTQQLDRLAYWITHTVLIEELIESSIRQTAT